MVGLLNNILRLGRNRGFTVAPTLFLPGDELVFDCSLAETRLRARTDNRTNTNTKRISTFDTGNCESLNISLELMHSEIFKGFL